MMRPKTLLEVLLTFLLAKAPGIAIGIGIFIGLTVLFNLAGAGGPPVERRSMVMLLLTVVALLFLPFTRSVAIGFLVAFLVMSVPQRGFYTRMWWEPVAFYMARATAPIRLGLRGAREKREWLATRRTKPLDIDQAIFRARQLHSGCLRRALEGRTESGVPTALEITEPDDCRDFRRDALDIAARWPNRFHRESDKGWRWTLTATNAHTSLWGGQGFVLTFKPEPLLGRAGPILELDGQDLLRLRESATSPARIARTPLPAMKRVRECLLMAGVGVPDDTLRWQYLPEASEMRRACRDMRIVVSGSSASDGGRQLEVSFKEAPESTRVWSLPILMGYTVLAPRQFELSVTYHLRHYLSSADNSFHVTVEDRRARPTDPAPLPCEIDPSIFCD